MKDQRSKAITVHGKVICAKRTGTEINKLDSLNSIQMVNLNITKMKKTTKDQSLLVLIQKSLRKVSRRC